MNQRSKLNSREQEQEQAPLQHTQQPAVHQFANPEEMLRHDALRTPVPPAIAHRLRESIGKPPPQGQQWWKRWFGGSH